LIKKKKHYIIKIVNLTKITYKGEKMTKTQKTYLSIFLAVFAVLLVIGSIFDLQISKELADLNAGSYYSHNFFAIFFECVAEFIMFVLVSIACTIIFFFIVKKPFNNNVLNVVLPIASLSISFVSLFIGIRKTLGYIANYTHFGLNDFLNSTTGKFAYTFLALAVAGLLLIPFVKVKRETLAKLVRWAVIVLVVCAVSTAIVQSLKYIFTRTRYRAMVYEGYTEFEYYTPWYVINRQRFSSIFVNAGDYFKSFPSGHVSSATSIFLLTLLPGILNKGKKLRISLIVVSTLYVALVMLARIVAGAHFFTDVLFAAGITMLLILVSKIVLERKLHDEQVAK